MGMFSLEVSFYLHNICHGFNMPTDLKFRICLTEGAVVYFNFHCDRLDDTRYVTLLTLLK